MAAFFIERPVFAWVITLFIMLAGIVSLLKLPINQYPAVGAPAITVSSYYPGASAQAHEDGVLALIERQMFSLSGLDYVQTEANSDGSGSVTLTFKSGTDQNIAQIDVQNALRAIEPRLPQSVRSNGLSIRNMQSNFLLLAVLSSDEPDISVPDINDYAIRHIRPELERIEGIGNVQVFGSERAMRIWLKPDRMRSFGIHTSDITQAIAAQNIQIPAGAIGGLPSLPGQAITANIVAPSQLQTVQDFNDIVISSAVDGSTVRLSEVARVELGQQNYDTEARVNGKAAVGMGVQLSTEGNAVAVATAVKEKLQQLQPHFPHGVQWSVPYDTSMFVHISIQKVLITLLEAVALVFIVMLLFLQNIRYTLIPTLVVPVSLLGATAVMAAFGMSINVLTMFAMVLVIGIVVDDAIVVVENVERLMNEEGLSPKAAAHKGMRQISGAVIGITVVLMVVFVPLAFFPGASGNIYRQFSLVMMAAIGFSAFMALSLTPALCATLLKPTTARPASTGANSSLPRGFMAGFANGFANGFNRLLKRTTSGYQSVLSRLLRNALFMLVLYLVLAAAAALIYRQLPASFIPQEDQGFVMTSVQLPAGATRERTLAVMQQVEQTALEQPEIKDIVSILGFSFSGRGQNMGLAFLVLQDWSQRPLPQQSADGIAARMIGILSQVRDAFIFSLSPPAIPELGNSSGFDLRLQDRGSMGHEALLKARNQLLQLAAQRPELTGVRPSGLEDAPVLELTINRQSAYAKGVSIASIAGVLATETGSAYVNDFSNQGRMQRVVVMAEAVSRMQGDDIMQLTVPNNRGELVSLSELTGSKWRMGATQLRRYNGYPSMSINGSAAPGYSSGDAMKVMQELVQQLPEGTGMEWTGQSLEEQRTGSMSLTLYAFSILAVFLCLAALYESWSVPLAVMLVVPLGFLGVVLGVFGRGMANDIYFQVGMITVIGLSAKNAILIVEMARELQSQGVSLARAVLHAARLRFRPIIMTSLAFIAGVVPLYIATGASSVSQRAVGTSVLWGMLIGTLLALFFVPIFYAAVRRLFPATPAPQNPAPHASASHALSGANTGHEHTADENTADATDAAAGKRTADRLTHSSADRHDTPSQQ